MKATIIKSGAILSMLATTALFAGGCGQQAADRGGPADVTDAAHDDHSGWWCAGHSVPEAVCSMCSAKAAKECKAKGDWCEEHNRAESQCFQCDPSRAEKFANLYQAKFGKEPPKLTE